ncbi:hypothetical protein RMATCC62417_16934 [Rhizopus microsporus]|nr:hypothetical protein RMATCC62417_16934 [Rhizopus microsporus]
MHDITVPPRKTDVKHKRTDDITFVTMERGTQHDNAKQKLACPSCLFYYEQKSDLKSHFDDVHLRKRFFDHSESTPELVKRGKIVSIPGERHFYTFVASDRQSVPNLPKITVDPVDNLKDIMTIIMPDNSFLCEAWKKKILDAEEFDQYCLKTLKQFRNVYQLLQPVLQKPYKEVPYSLWTCQLLSTMSSIET